MLGTHNQAHLTTLCMLTRWNKDTELKWDSTLLSECSSEMCLATLKMCTVVHNDNKNITKQRGKYIYTLIASHFMNKWLPCKSMLLLHLTFSAWSKQGQHVKVVEMKWIHISHIHKEIETNFYKVQTHKSTSVNRCACLTPCLDQWCVTVHGRWPISSSLRQDLLPGL